MTTQEINEAILKLENRNEISDGYHTFGELYEHRYKLLIALLKTRDDAWKTLKNKEGELWEGWFICGCGEYGKTQISYHLPINLWDKCEMDELEKAPWDGHTSADVLERLLKI